MRDSDVRSALHVQLVHEHSADLDSTLFVDELGLCGEVRVDVAVVNAALSGFELKSASDTLRRFPTQVDVYSRVLDYCTIVAASNHLEQVRAMIPAWWGCMIAEWDGKRVELDLLVVPQLNPRIDPYSLAQMLWRDEALAALETFNAVKGFRSKPRTAIWRHLSEVTDLDHLRTIVREQLKSRQRWRVGSRSIQSGRELEASGAGCRPSPRSADYQ